MTPLRLPMRDAHDAPRPSHRAAAILDRGEEIVERAIAWALAHAAR